MARRVNTFIPSFKDLGLPDIIEKLCNFPEGLVILAGVTGSGKSTTIASMLDYIAEREPLHILTVEDPIEFTFTDKKSYINQREIGLDVHRLAQGAQGRGAARPRRHPRRRVARRRDLRGRRPRRRDGPLGVRHHPRFDRVDHHQPHPRPVPAGEAQRHPPGLANNLKAVVAQKLLKGLKKAALPTNEIMIVNPTIRKLIAEGEDSKMPDAIRIVLQRRHGRFHREPASAGRARRRRQGDGPGSSPPTPRQLKMAFKGIKVSAPGIL